MDDKNTNLLKDINWNDSSKAFKWSLIIGVVLISLMILLVLFSAESSNIGLIISLVVLIFINATPALYNFLLHTSESAIENKIDKTLEEIVLKFLVCWFSVIFALAILGTRVKNELLLMILFSIALIIVALLSIFLILKNRKFFQEIVNSTFVTIYEIFKHMNFFSHDLPIYFTRFFSSVFTKLLEVIKDIFKTK